MLDITFLGESFKAVNSAREASSIITQPMPDSTQNGLNEFWIYRIPDVTFLGEFFNVTKGSPFGFFGANPI